MAPKYSSSDLRTFFEADLTETSTFTSEALRGVNFDKTFQMITAPTRWQEYVDNFKAYLIHNNGYFLFSQDKNLSMEKLNQDNRRYEIIIEKNRILALIDFLERTHCRALKLCFGINTPLGSGGYHQMLATGSFQGADDKKDDKIIDNLLTINGDRIYFLNLDISNIITEKEAANYNKNFEATITNHDEKRVMGYLLGTRTFRSMLTKADYLGSATTIRFSLAMNKFEPDTDEGQIVLVKIDSPEVESKSYYLFDKNLRENDEDDCPPRNPCGPQSS